MCLGTIDIHNDAAVLTAASIHADIQDLFAKVTVSQTFTNTSATETLEITYTFPLASSAAVSTFHAEIGGKKVVSKLFEKQMAKDQFDDAISSGFGAFIGEQAEGNNFKCSVGSLQPNSEVKCVLTYVDRLTYMDNEIQFSLPVLRTSTEVDFSANIVTSSKLVSVEGDLKNIVIDGHKVTHKIQTDEAMTLLITVAEPHTPTAVGELTPSKDGIACFSFHPDMSQQEENEEVNSEVILLIDCSGSMSGGAIKKVNQAVSIILRSLPESCKFNIIDFGSTERRLFGTVQSYSDETLRKAVDANQCRNADLGGTELLRPLGAILADKPTVGFSRQIFLLTDGEVSDRDDCIEVARTQSSSTRIFTFGIGREVDRSLVTEIAKASNGRSEFVDAGNMQEAVMRQMNFAMKPCLSEVKIDLVYKGSDKRQNDEDDHVTLTPYHPAPIFSGGVHHAFVRFSEQKLKELSGSNVVAKLSGKFGSSPWSQEVTFDTSSFMEKKIRGPPRRQTLWQVIDRRTRNGTQPHA